MPVGWLGRSLPVIVRVLPEAVARNDEVQLTLPETAVLAVRSYVPSLLIQGPSRKAPPPLNVVAQDHTERVENEIVFVLVPHIVRGQELSELNQRALDVGTGNALDLRRVPAKQPLQAIPAVPAQQTPVPITQMTQPQIQTTQLGGQTGQPPLATPTQSQPTNAPPSATTPPAATPQQNPVAALHIEPPTLTANLGENFSVQIAVSGGQDIYSAPMQISYDPKSLQVISISNGDLLSRDGQAVALVHREDVDAGVIQVNATRPPGAGGVTGSGVLYTITFQGKQKATSTLNIVRPMARNGQMQPMPLAPASAVINIK